MPRNSGSKFTDEYQINGVKPYDADYYLNYHRPVFLDSSTTPPTACVIAPGALPGAANTPASGRRAPARPPTGPGAGQAATDFPPDGIIMRPYGAPTVTSNPSPGACSQLRTSSTRPTSSPTAPSPRRRR